jgi:peptidoglycan/xylan/chitin deacetylase (PgdA/CDA1 family)
MSTLAIKKIFMIPLVALSLLAGSVPMGAVMPAYAAGENIVPNPSLEQASLLNSSIPDQWGKGRWGTNTAVFTYPVPGYNGGKAALVDLVSRTSGDVKWYFKPISIKPGTTYTFSDYAKSNVSQYITAEYELAGGTKVYKDLATPGSSSDWQHNEVTFTTPANAVKLSMFHLINKVGSLTIDEFDIREVGGTPIPTPTPSVTPSPSQSPSASPTPSPSASPSPSPIPSASPSPAPTPSVVPSPSPSPTPTPGVTCDPQAGNMIANPSVEMPFDNDPNATLPCAWRQGNYGNNQAVFSYPVQGYNSSRAVKVELLSRSSGDAKWYPREVDVTPGGFYSFEDDYKSTVPSTITAQWRMINGPYVYTYTYKDLAQLPASAGWTHAKVKFAVPLDAKGVTIFHLIEGVGALTVDNYNMRAVSSDPTTFSEGLVSFTFDDGYRSTYDTAMPILDSKGYAATVYIPSARITPEGTSLYMSTSEALGMQAKGYEIGSHSRTHTDLTILNDASLLDEVAGSRTELANLGFGMVKSFAYPFGSYDERVVQAVNDAGYESARTTDDGSNPKIGTDPYLLHREGLQVTTTLDQVKGWVDTALQDKTWLVINMHRVDTSGTQYSTAPQDLEQIVDYIASKNAKVVTISQGVQILSQ